MTHITEEQIGELEKLHAEAFRAPWTYARWQVECSACEGGSNEPEAGCTDPDCDGAHVPIVQVDSPEEYPNGQTVAQISVPGLLCLADKNGALIVGMRNALPSLIAAAKRSLEYEAFFREHRLALVNGLAIRRMQALNKHHEDDLRKPEAALEALLSRLK